MRQQLHQIFVIVALPTILSLGLLVFLLRDSLQDWAIERWSSDQYAFVESLAHDIDSDIKQAAELLRVAAATDAFAALTERKHIDLGINGIPEHLDRSKRRVMEHLRTSGGFSVVFVLTPEGDHYISHPFTVQRSLKKYNLSDRSYFQQAKATRKLSISDSFAGADGVPAVAIDLPIVDAQGEIVMHLGGVLYLKHLSDFLAAHKINPFDHAVLKDRKNQRIAESDANRLAKPVAEPLLAYSSSANDIVKTTAPELSTYNTHTARFSDGSGKRWFAYDATLSSGWHLMLFRSEAALNSVIAPQVRQITLFAAAIVLLPGLIGLGVANRFRRRWLDARNKLVASHQMLEQRVAERTNELQRSETQHRTLFEASADGILILDGDRFIDCNPAAIKLFGAASRDDLLAHHPWELSPPGQPELGDSKNAAQIAIKKALDNGFNDFEWRHRRLDNQNDFVARVLLSRMEIDDRALLQASIRDVTAQKQASELLKASEAIHHNVLETALDGFWRVDAQGHLLEVNPAYAQQSGYSREELLEMHVTDLEAKEDAHETDRHIEQVIAAGHDRFETRHRRKDGSLWDVEISTTFSRIGGEHFVTFLRDITERKRAEEALRESEARFHMALKNSSIVVFNQDPELRYTWIYNPHPKFDPQAILGKTDAELFPEGDAARLTEIKRRVLETGVSAREEVRTTIDGQACFYDLAVEPLRNLSGDTTGVTCVSVDITELKKAQEMIEKRLVALTQPLGSGLVAFDELFSLSEIRRIQDEFASATGVASIITHPDGTPITAPSNFTRLCSEIIRKTEKGCSNCYKSDAIIGNVNPDGPIIQPCLSGGLWDAGASIVVGGHHIANWLIGQVRDATQTDEDMLDYAREIGADEDLFLEAFHDVPCMSRERFGLIAQALFTVANTLSASAYQTIQQARFIAAQKRIDSLLNFIALRGWSKDGQAFLPALAQTFGEMLQVDYVLIDRLSDDPEQAETAGLYARGTVAPNLSYCLAGTPCENIIGKEACVYPRGVQQLFPEDSLLVDMEAESYIGVPLWDSAGQAIGLIAVVDSKPLDDGDELLGLLNLVSAAASAELERLRDERALARSEQKYRDYFEQSPIGLALCGMDGQLISVNPAYAKIIGYDVEEALKLSYWEITPEKYADNEQAQLKSLESTGRYGPYEKEYRHKDGHLVPVRLNGMIVTWDEEKYIWSSVEDITELANTEAERSRLEGQLLQTQKMESIGQLTGGIAHDFNNILGIIMGNLDLLKHQVTDDKALKRVETIKGSAQRAADLTKQLLGFSRQQSTQRVRTDIRRVIREMESLIARSLSPEIAVEQQFAEDLWLTEIDAGDFQDALLNLAINARDAMPGGGQLILEARNCTLDAAYCAQNPGATPGEYVQLAVSDNGMGIAPENREKIFEPFFTTKPQGKGTGLGLAMVYGFTQRSKGYIQVYSEQDIGTTIRLYLPRAEGEEQPLASGARPAEHLPRGRETILVVDDEEELLQLAQQSLQALGYRVLTACDGQQAMKRLAEEPGIDLLFSDVVMPGGMNGYELAEQATSAYPQLKVLLTSGYTGKAVAHNGQARFAANLLSKPYSQAELAQGVRRLLGEPDMPEPTRNEPGHQTPAQASVEAIEWTDALSIGVDAIDADHKTLLALLNRSQQPVAEKESEQHIHSILDELGDYVETHFQREEAVMAAVDYPGLENHRQVHRLLLKQVKKNRKLLKRGELTTGDLMALLHSWLVDHIDNMDGAIKPYCEGKDDLIEQALEQAGIARKKEGQS